MSHPENCHVFHLDKFIPGFLDFLGEYIGFDNNKFYIWGAERYAFGLTKDHPIHWVYDNSTIKDLLDCMCRSKRVFLHGLFVPMQIEILYQNQTLLRKCFWIIWGGDLYCYRDALLTGKKRTLESRRRVVIRDMGHIITGTPGDFELAVRVYRTSAVYIQRLVYPSNCGSRLYAPTGNSLNGKVNVLVGNSATPENRHDEAFSKLSNFLGRINIFCPLSYGLDDYREKVIDLGVKTFGDSFKPLLGWLNIKEYTDFLKGMDIGFFNHNRQQAAGNIIMMLGFGKKVFAPHNLTHIKWLSSLGVTVYSPEEFSLASLSKEISLRNHQVVNHSLSTSVLKDDLLHILHF